MDTLDRFLLREFIVYFVLILFGLALLFLGVDFLTKFWKFQLPMGKILAMYSYKVPAALQQFVPVACLMATLLVLTNMSRQNEVLALYTSGISTLRLISTFIAAVATVSTLSFLIFDALVPTLNRKEILVAKGLEDTEENVLAFNAAGFWYRTGRLAYKVGRFVPETNSLQEVNVYLFTPSFYLLESIYAREAHFENDDWVLRDGLEVTYPEDTKFPISRPFATKTGVIPEKPKDFKTLKVQEETMRLKDLRRYIDRNSSYGLDTTTQKVHYHERVALVFTPLVFILLGIPFAITPLKTQSTPKSISFCFLVVFIYLVMFRMSLSVGKGGHIPPVVAAWAPNLLFLTLASLRILRT